MASMPDLFYPVRQRDPDGPNWLYTISPGVTVRYIGHEDEFHMVSKQKLTRAQLREYFNINISLPDEHRPA